MYEEDKWDVSAELADKIVETIGEAGGKYSRPTKTTRVSHSIYEGSGLSGNIHTRARGAEGVSRSSM